MKRTCLIVILWTIFIIQSPAQNNETYSYWINCADLAICNENYEAASDNYVKAFATANPFTSDLFAYFWIYQNFGIGEKEDLIFWAHKLAQREKLSLEMYQADILLYPILKNLLDTTISTLNIKLISEFKTLVERDQEVRLRHDYSSAEERYNVIRETDSLNLLKIKELYRLYPVINNDNAGFFEQDVRLILLHCSQNGIKGIPWDLFEEQVSLNRFSANDYMAMYDECTQWEAYTDSLICSGYGTNLGCQRIVGNTLFIYPPDNIDETNKNRERLGVAETWQDYKKKLVYTFFSNNFGFVALQEDVWGDDTANERAAAKEREKIDRGQIKGEYFIKEKK